MIEHSMVMTSAFTTWRANTQFRNIICELHNRVMHAQVKIGSISAQIDMKFSPTFENIHMQESKPVPNELKTRASGSQVHLTSYAQIKNMQMSLILLCCTNSEAITILDSWLPTGCNLYKTCNDFLGFACHKEGLLQLCC